MSLYDIVPAHLAVEAMRDNGYKNAAYALAELMDNSIQAGATNVQLLCGESTVLIEQRNRRRIVRIAVLDNGCGMDSATLRKALQFGNGTHLEEASRTGMGRFGMGLPSSSISQCRQVDVWSWQSGPSSAIHSHLDIDQIKRGIQAEVPEPTAKPIPEKWMTVGDNFGKSGTLVVWSKIDRCVWRTASSIIDNSSDLIGRMYRQFLESDEVVIRMASFDWEAARGDEGVVEKFAKPNDPGYLIERTSCPAPFSDVPMFDPWGDGPDGHVSTISVNWKGRPHEIKIRYSVAKEAARRSENGRNPGDLPHGKHAQGNVGVSIMRAQRELELDQSWVIKYDTTERWWGVEVEFPPALDEIFGVTNNKQSARNFSELAKLDVEALQQEKGCKNIQELKGALEDDEDLRGPLLEVAQQIKNRLNVVRRLVKAQTRNTRGGTRRHTVPPAEEVATAATRIRQREGFSGKSDADERLSTAERLGMIEESLRETGFDSEAASQIAARALDNGLKYIFAEAEIESPAFFSVKPKGGTVIITLNTSHPGYTNLVEILEADTGSSDPAVLQTRLANALEGVKLLLMAWARYEDEQPDGAPRSRAQETRVDWGKMAKKFLEAE